MRRIYSFSIAALSLLFLGSQLNASAAAGGPAPAEHPSMCPILRMGDFNDIAASIYEMPEGKRWTTIQGPGLSLQSWSQGINPGVEIQGVRQKIAVDTSDKNLAVLAKEENQGIEILRMTTHLIPLTPNNVGPGKFFNYITESDPNKVGCTYVFYPTRIGRPGPLEGIKFSIWRDKLPGEEGGNPPTAEQQAAAKTAYEAQIHLPLKLRSNAEVAYMNGLSAGSAALEAAAAAAVPAIVPAPAAPQAAFQLFPLPPLVEGQLNFGGRNMGPAGALALGNYLRDHPIAGLTNLYLDDNNIGDEGVEALAPHLPATLTHLFLRNNNIGDAGITALAQHLPANLTELHIGENDIGDVGVAALALRLPARLRYLALKYNNISILGVQALAPHLPANLQVLYFGDNNIDAAVVQALAPHLPASLQILDLAGNNIGDAGVQALTNARFAYQGNNIWSRAAPQAAPVAAPIAAEANIPAVQLFPLPPLANGVLNLRNQDIDAAEALALGEHLRDHPIVGLTILVLDNNNIGAAGVTALAPNLPANLINLYISSNNIGDEGVEALALHLPETLTKLFLAYNNIGDAGITALAQHLPANLTELDLEGNIIGDVGVAALALRLPASLRYLFLKYNNISIVGVQALAPHLPENLQVLYFGDNNIDAAVVQALAPHLPANLQVLHLAGNNIGDAGSHALINVGFAYQGDNIWSRAAPAAPAPLAAPIAPAVNVHQVPLFPLPPLVDGSLSLINRNIGVAGALALSEYLRTHPIDGLTSLDLSSCYIGDAGIQALAPNLPENLNKLYLDHNNISDAGAQALAPHLPENLQVLDLYNNNIDAAVVQALAPHLPANLTELYLSHNNIDDAAAQALTNEGFENEGDNLWTRAALEVPAPAVAP